MGIYSGSTPITQIYLGDDRVSSVYAGSDLVFYTTVYDSGDPLDDTGIMGFYIPEKMRKQTDNFTATISNELTGLYVGLTAGSFAHDVGIDIDAGESVDVYAQHETHTVTIGMGDIDTANPCYAYVAGCSGDGVSPVNLNTQASVLMTANAANTFTVNPRGYPNLSIAIYVNGMTAVEGFLVEYIQILSGDHT